MQLDWTANRWTNCCYAAAGLARGLPPADPRLAKALREPARRLQQILAASDLPTAQFWQATIAGTHQTDDPQMLARRALRRTVGLNRADESLVARIANAIAAVEAAAAEALPTLTAELEHRGRPLRQLWEARGPGLLNTIGQLTEPRLLAERSTVVLVYPTFGGGGLASPRNGSVAIEALLTNINNRLPEVLRLGWLLSQLQQQPPVSAGQSDNGRGAGQRFDELAALALLPPTLQAGEAVELSSLAAETLAAAITSWRINIVTSVDLPSVLLDWWSTYTQTRPAWHVALGALDRMLAG